LEPDIKVDVRGAVYYPGDAQIVPQLLVKNLVQYLKNKGVKFYENNEVIDFEIDNAQIRAVQTQNLKIEADEFVVATGAWSATLTQKLGISLPLQGGKGYSFMVENPMQKVKIPAIMLEARATATQMGEELRFAGTMEIAGTDMRVNPNRVRGIVQAINNYYPDFKVDMPNTENVWRGLRPCSPDGLPYIGRIKNFKNLTLATGHGMMGVSLGPATGKLVSEIIANQKLSMNIQAFEPLRFG
jgi:D-amino-acid dehydrogenase